MCIWRNNPVMEADFVIFPFCLLENSNRHSHQFAAIFSNDNWRKYLLVHVGMTKKLSKTSIYIDNSKRYLPFNRNKNNIKTV